MGFQSSLFYVTISWLPEILHSNGISIAMAGWMLSYTQIIGMPASFLVPVVAGRVKAQRGRAVALGLFAIGGFCWFLFTVSITGSHLAMTSVGISPGGRFGLALH